MDNFFETWIGSNLLFNLVTAMQDSRVVPASEVVTQLRGRTLGHFPAKKHGNLARKRKALGPFFAFNVRNRNAKIIGYRFLNEVDGNIPLAG